MDSKGGFNEEEALQQLINGINGIIVKNEEAKKDKKSRQETYANIYHLYNAMGEKLFEKITSLLNDFSDHCKAIIENRKSEHIIPMYAKVWDDYISKAKKVNEMLQVLNKKQITNYRVDPSIHGPTYGDHDYEMPACTIIDHMRKNWIDMVFNLKNILVEAVLQDLQKKRQGEYTQNENFIEVIINSFTECEQYMKSKDLYSELLEKPLLVQTENYYKNLSEKLASSESSEGYFNNCYSLLQNEETIAKTTFPLSEQLMCTIAWNRLVLDRVNIIMTAVTSFMFLERYESLRLCYKVMSVTTETSDMFCKGLMLHEEKVFLRLCSNVEDVMFCEKFVEKFEERQQVIQNLYDSNTAVKIALDEAIRKTLNVIPKTKNHEASDPNATAEITLSKMPIIITNYCNHFLKKGTLALSDEELDKKLEGALTLLKYVDDKDAFFHLYAKSLGGRLIESISQSIDAEELMIQKMSNIYGNMCVSNLKDMVSDYKISLEVTTEFKKTAQSNIPYSFNITVLKSSSCPIGEGRSSLLVPQELLQGMRLFNIFYEKKYECRKLMWNHDLSSCEVKLNYLTKSYCLNMPVNTFTLLIIFNSTDSATTSDLVSMTGIELKKLIKYLEFLVREKILLCDDDNIVEESTIALNYKYENKRQYLKLKPQLKDPTNEAEQTLRSVEGERKYYLQALIVRIMKRNKTMPHSDLVNEIIRLSMSSFAPSLSLIRRTIDTLIEKTYLEEKDGVYHFFE